MAKKKRILVKDPAAIRATIAKNEATLRELTGGHQPRTLRRNMQIDAYVLTRRIGRGASAEVWEAEVAREIPGVDLDFGEIVAIKFYSLPLLQGAETLRIQREFSIASDLDHSNLARVFDLVISPNRPFHSFMVMELVEGQTVKDHVSEVGPMKTADIIRVGMLLFSALDELHSHGAIHRDVKPSNVMIEYIANIPRIKLVDLGIVTVTNEPSYTATSAFLGSKHSAPIEQLTGGALDHRTDIYGAGATLFSCYAGQPMYDGVGPEGAIVQRMMTNPEKLTMRSSVPDDRDRLRESELVSIINQCIAFSRHERPQTAKVCEEKFSALMGSANAQSGNAHESEGDDDSPPGHRI